MLYGNKQVIVEKRQPKKVVDPKPAAASSRGGSSANGSAPSNGPSGGSAPLRPSVNVSNLSVPPTKGAKPNLTKLIQPTIFAAMDAKNGSRKRSHEPAKTGVSPPDKRSNNSSPVSHTSKESKNLYKESKNSYQKIFGLF